MPRARTQRPAARRQRKTLDLDQHLLDEAKRVLGAATETETVRIALERVLNNRRVIEGLRALAAMNLKINRARIEE